MKPIFIAFTILFALAMFNLHAEADIDTLIAEGKANYAVENYKTAYGQFKAAMKINPNHTEAMSWYWKMKKEFDVSRLTDSGRSIAGKETTPEVTEPTKESTKIEPPAEKKPEKNTASRSAGESVKIRELNRKLANIERNLEIIKNRKEPIKERIIERIPAPVSFLSFKKPEWILSILLGSIIIILVFLISILRGKKKKYREIANAAPGLGLPQSSVNLPVLNNSLRIPQQSGYQSDNFTTGFVSPRGTQPVENNALTRDFNSDSFTKGFVNLLDKKFPRVDNTRRVRNLSHEIGNILRLTPEQKIELRLTATLRDIGFLLIPEEILLKPDSLTERERLEIMKHPDHSVDILSGMSLPDRVVQSILHHHERMDGSGYPYGLIGEEIPLYSRIVGVAETYIALTTPKSYKPSMTPTEAFEKIVAEQDLFDEKVIDALATRLENTVEN